MDGDDEKEEEKCIKSSSFISQCFCFDYQHTFI